MRIARVLKLARHSRMTKKLFISLKDSNRQLLLLALLMAVVVVLFSSTIYYCEKDVPDTAFASIPSAFWLVINTVTVVGYGDMLPKTACKWICQFKCHFALPGK